MSENEQQEVPATDTRMALVISAGPHESRRLAAILAQMAQVIAVENISFISTKELVPTLIDMPAIYIEPQMRSDVAALRRSVLAREKKNRKAIMAKGRR